MCLISPRGPDLRTSASDRYVPAGTPGDPPDRPPTLGRRPDPDPDDPLGIDDPDPSVPDPVCPDPITARPIPV